MTNESETQSGGGDLSEVKRQVRGKYLGKFGIHAVGTRSSEDAICVYLSPGEAEQQQALTDLKQEIAPHNLIVVEEGAPKVQ